MLCPDSSWYPATSQPGGRGIIRTLIAALPLLVYLLFRSRAQRVMPQVREWMNTHSWLVNIIACGIFIVLILF